MRIPFLTALAAAALAGCGPPDIDHPSMVAAPKIAREVLHAPAGGYPLETCVVCGEKLGEKGNPYIFLEGEVEVRLCCVDCKKGFEAEPETFLGKIRDARNGK